MAKKIIRIILWSIALLLTAISFGFSVIQSKKLTCQDVKVAITDSSEIGFLRSRDIEQWVRSNYQGIIGKSVDNLKLRRIEENLERIHAIEKVSVYTNVFNNGEKNAGSVVVRIKQRTPVCRVMGFGHTFYIDQYGKSINWSPRYTPRVIVVGGNFSGEYAKEKLVPLISFLNEDEFWGAQIDQIYVGPTGELTLIPRVGDQTILFGTPDDYLIKFRNLKALYTQGFKTEGWTTYKTINAKFLNQIVCTKK
jgi:cell division protein FtsQ